jgi:hypothetical protein
MRWLRIMLHLHRTSKIVIRLVLLLLIVQFVTPAFANVGTEENSIHEKNSYKNQHDSGITVSILLKENSEERDEADEKHQVACEIIDFTFLAVGLTQSHSQILFNTDTPRPVLSPLFKLFCAFLI